MILSAVFLIGFSTLAFEVLLTRIFSITQWNHLSFMVISIALFGFAASGTFLSILNARQGDRRCRQASSQLSAALWVTLCSATTLMAFIVVNNLPLDYFRLPVEPVQSLYILAAFIILALPFFFSGGLVAFAYTRRPQLTGSIYFATMSGSACGAVSPALLLPLFSEGQLIVFFALIPLLVVPFGLRRRPQERMSETKPQLKPICFIILVCVMSGAGLFWIFTDGQHLIAVKPSAYKTLYQVLQFPDTRVEQTVNTIRGRIERVSSPYIRFAPGLSLRYTESLVPQTAIFRDGDHQLVLYTPNPPQSVQFAPYTLGYSGYQLHPSAQKVLIILQNGGSAMANVLAAGIKDVTLVVENPSLAEIIRNHYAREVVARPPRSYLSRIIKRFDIIHVESWGTSIPGSAALNQDHLFTSDAILQYLNHLTPDGLIIAPRRLLLPPADSLRLWASAYEGLKKMTAADPTSHLAILRNWDTFVLLISKSPFRNVARLKAFATKHNFDVVYLPGLTSDQANRFNQFDAPYHFNEINRLAAEYRQGKENAYFKSYLLDVRPQSDNRPFPGRYLKWPKIRALYQTLGSRLYALLMSGELVVMVVLIEAMVVSGMLLLLPLVFVHRRTQKPSRTQVVYFLGIGAGFMFVELFFIKKFMLLWADPVISFSVVVAGVLIFSSLGGAWAHKQDKSVLKKALYTLLGLLLAAFVALDPLIRWLLGCTLIWQYAVALLIIGPIGFLMGLPFTIGMRDMLSSAAQRAYAWSANGCASVLSSIVAAQIALAFGMVFILLSAIAAYGIVTLSWQQMNKS
jgi:MFS family permease